MLGYDAIIVLLLIGVLAVLVPFLGGLRGLYTPDVTPFFLRKTRDEQDEATPETSDDDAAVRKQERREAA